MDNMKQEPWVASGILDNASAARFDLPERYWIE